MGSAASQRAQVDESRARYRRRSRSFVDRSSVGDWFNGKTKSLKGKPAVGAAAYLDVAVLWLTSGKGPRLQSPSQSNVEEARDMRGAVPVISWVAAGSWNGADDPLHPGEAERLARVLAMSSIMSCR